MSRCSRPGHPQALPPARRHVRQPRVRPGRGTRSSPHRDHVVKLDVAGLRPDRRYFYRFPLDGVRTRR
ncbi:PhoD-like phosphatase N-terminal domain-containing protein [Actinosynnema sp. NPDC050436]|uniref:PhoD-like phosphatase N-terminal domain-containing protein n=1 Tax=Actinosynnema sp. NPDC050436 TaxID=3155659 RepID=UPI0033CA1807